MMRVCSSWGPAIALILLPLRPLCFQSFTICRSGTAQVKAPSVYRLKQSSTQSRALGVCPHFQCSCNFETDDTHCVFSSMQGSSPWGVAQTQSSRCSWESAKLRRGKGAPGYRLASSARLSHRRKATCRAAPAVPVRLNDWPPVQLPTKLQYGCLGQNEHGIASFQAPHTSASTRETVRSVRGETLLDDGRRTLCIRLVGRRPGRLVMRQRPP